MNRLLRQNPLGLGLCRTSTISLRLTQPLACRPILSSALHSVKPSGLIKSMMPRPTNSVVRTTSWTPLLSTRLADVRLSQTRTFNNCTKALSEAGAPRHVLRGPFKNWRDRFNNSNINLVYCLTTLLWSLFGLWCFAYNWRKQ